MTSRRSPQWLSSRFIVRLDAHLPRLRSDTDRSRLISHLIEIWEFNRRYFVTTCGGCDDSDFTTAITELQSRLSRFERRETLS